MAAVLRRFISHSSRCHPWPISGRFPRPISTAEAIYPQTDAEQIKLLSSYLSSGLVSETVTKLLQWRYHNVEISDAVYRHVVFASVHFDRPTMEALCSFFASRDREAATLLKIVKSPKISTDVLSSASQWSSALLCKAIEIVAEKPDAAAIGILQRALLCRADLEAIQRAAPHIIHTRLATNTHAQIAGLMDIIRAFKVQLKSPAFAGVFDVDRGGSSLAVILEVYESCVQSSLYPDAQIFSDLLHSTIRSGAHQSVIRRVTKRLMKYICQSNIEADIGLILEACARGAMPSEGLRLICDLGVEFRPDYAISLVKACANIHDRKTALFHLRAVETAFVHFEVKFTDDDYRALLHTYAEFGRDRLETIMALSQELPNLNVKDVTARLRACHNNIEEALMLLPRDTDCGELRPIPDHFRLALLTMAKTRSYDLALRLLDLFNGMRNRNLFVEPLESRTLTAIYTLVLRSADGQDFEQFLRRFLYKDKIGPDSVTLIAVYEYCAGKSLNHWNQTKYLIDELKGRVRVDGAVCSFAVRLLLRLGLLEEAVQLVSESQRHRPDRNRIHPATYRTLLKALVKAKDRIRAQQVLDMQRGDGFKIRPSHLQLVQSLT